MSIPQGFNCHFFICGFSSGNRLRKPLHPRIFIIIGQVRLGACSQCATTFSQAIISQELAMKGQVRSGACGQLAITLKHATTCYCQDFQKQRPQSVQPQLENMHTSAQFISVDIKVVFNRIITRFNMGELQIRLTRQFGYN